MSDIVVKVWLQGAKIEFFVNKQTICIKRSQKGGTKEVMPLYLADNQLIMKYNSVGKITQIASINEKNSP
jgi:hypothetical protein